MPLHNLLAAPLPVLFVLLLGFFAGPRHVAKRRRLLAFILWTAIKILLLRSRLPTFANLVSLFGAVEPGIFLGDSWLVNIEKSVGHKFMNALTTKKPLIEDHDLKPDQSVRSSEGRSLVRLFRTAVFGLLSAVAAIFTTMLPMPDSWRSFWLIICVFALALAVTGIVMFERSYKR
jgi:hypothetical protein